MRVRKSVPEGYKTHKTLGTDAFARPASTMPLASTALVRPVPGFGDERKSRELAPFCGLHKIGGLAAQEEAWVPASSAPAACQTGDGGHEYGDVPALSWSQSTVASTQRTMAAESGVKKRLYEEEIEDDLDVIFDDVDFADAEPTMRVIAKPKTNLRQAVTGSGRSASDFDEAQFLAPMDMDGA